MMTQTLSPSLYSWWLRIFTCGLLRQCDRLRFLCFLEICIRITGSACHCCPPNWHDPPPDCRQRLKSTLHNDDAFAMQHVRPLIAPRALITSKKFACLELECQATSAVVLALPAVFCLRSFSVIEPLLHSAPLRNAPKRTSVRVFVA